MKRLLAVLAALTVLVPTAFASSSHFLKASPNPVQAGNKVKVFGSVGTGCSKGSSVTIYSKAFKGSTTKDFAGIPAVYATVGNNSKFSRKVRIQSNIAAGKYHIGGRCGGGNFGGTKLNVTDVGFY
jgi:hypothetical protein